MIEKRLESLHKTMCRAAYLVGVQIVKRTLKREFLVEAVEQVKFTTAELERLIAEIDERRKNTNSPQNESQEQ